MIVLDTHTLLWWVNGDAALSRRASAVIEKELLSGEIIISSISALEIAALIKKDRLILSMDLTSWLATVAQIQVVRFMPIDLSIAVKSIELPGVFHRDPADRMIVATARELSAPLVTKDRKIRSYAHVKTIW